MMMTLNDICRRSSPYTQEEFMEGLIGTFSNESEGQKCCKIIVVMPNEDVKFHDHEEAIMFLFDKIFLFNWHAGNFAFSPTGGLLYISLFRNS